MADLKADEEQVNNLRQAYPFSFREVEDIVKAHGIAVVRKILDQIELEAEHG